MYSDKEKQKIESVKNQFRRPPSEEKEEQEQKKQDRFAHDKAFSRNLKRK